MYTIRECCAIVKTWFNLMWNIIVINNTKKRIIREREREERAASWNAKCDRFIDTLLRNALHHFHISLMTHSKHFKTDQIVYEIHTLQCTCTLISFKIWNSTTSTRSLFNPMRSETHSNVLPTKWICNCFHETVFFPDSISQRFLERDFVHTRFQSQDKLIVINTFFVIIVIECRLRFFELKSAERECANYSIYMPVQSIFINHNKSAINDQRWQLQLFLFCVLRSYICINHWNAGK